MASIDGKAPKDNKVAPGGENENDEHEETQDQ